MQFTYKTRSTHLLLSIPFNDKSHKSQIDILYLNTQHNKRGQHEKNNQFQHLKNISLSSN